MGDTEAADTVDMAVDTEVTGVDTVTVVAMVVTVDAMVMLDTPNTVINRCTRDNYLSISTTAFHDSQKKYTFLFHERIEIYLLFLHSKKSDVDEERERESGMEGEGEVDDRMMM